METSKLVPNGKNIVTSMAHFKRSNIPCVKYLVFMPKLNNKPTKTQRKAGKRQALIDAHTPAATKPIVTKPKNIPRPTFIGRMMNSMFGSRRAR